MTSGNDATKALVTAPRAGPATKDVHAHAGREHAVSAHLRRGSVRQTKTRRTWPIGLPTTSSNINGFRAPRLAGSVQSTPIASSSRHRPKHEPTSTTWSRSATRLRSAPCTARYRQGSSCVGTYGSKRPQPLMPTRSGRQSLPTVTTDLSVARELNPLRRPSPGRSSGQLIYAKRVQSHPGVPT